MQAGAYDFATHKLLMQDSELVETEDVAKTISR